MVVCFRCRREVWAEDAEPVAYLEMEDWRPTTQITDIEIWCDECARDVFEVSEEE